MPAIPALPSSRGSTARALVATPRAAVETGDHSCGLVATEDVTHNYVMAAVKRPFNARRLVLPRLRDAIGSFASSFRIEYVGEDQSRILKDVPEGMYQPGLTLGAIEEVDWSKWEQPDFDA
eukprot:7383848-Prymnesium_polylepis.1